MNEAVTVYRGELLSKNKTKQVSCEYSSAFGVVLARSEAYQNI